MEHGESNLCRRLLLRRMHPRGDASPVVYDRHTSVDMDRDVDGLTESRHMFVDAVVDDFIDEMMQSVDPRTADIHRRSFPDGIETLKDFNLIGAVAVRLGWRLFFRCHPLPIPSS